MDTKKRVIKVLKNLSGADEISGGDNIQNDIGLDSLNLVTMLIDLEDEFKIEFNESDMNPLDLNLVSDVVKLVERYIGDENESKNNKR